MIQSLPTLRRQFFAENKTFYKLPQDDPRTVRPLSLEQLRKQSKDLLKQVRLMRNWDRMRTHIIRSAIRDMHKTNYLFSL